MVQWYVCFNCIFSELCSRLQMPLTIQQALFVMENFIYPTMQVQITNLSVGFSNRKQRYVRLICLGCRSMGNTDAITGINNDLQIQQQHLSNTQPPTYMEYQMPNPTRIEINCDDRSRVNYRIDRCRSSTDASRCCSSSRAPSRRRCCQGCIRGSKGISPG
jgi:hypothetical protein